MAVIILTLETGVSSNYVCPRVIGSEYVRLWLWLCRGCSCVFVGTVNKCDTESARCRALQDSEIIVITTTTTTIGLSPDASSPTLVQTK